MAFYEPSDPPLDFEAAMESFHRLTKNQFLLEKHLPRIAAYLRAGGHTWQAEAVEMQYAKDNNYSK